MAALNKNKLFGFLYHPGSQQILLQQKINEEPKNWELLEDLSKFVSKGILPVYDYVAKGKKCVVSYAEVKTAKHFSDGKTTVYKWFTAKEISKLPLLPQTKQDLIVGRRVIDSQIRKDAGRQTIG